MPLILTRSGIYVFSLKISIGEKRQISVIFTTNSVVSNGNLLLSHLSLGNVDCNYDVKIPR